MLFALSFISADYAHTMDRETKRIEKNLHERQSIMESYALKVLSMPADEWVDFKDFPDDFVIYRYERDTLKSWINQFTVANDEIAAVPLRYRLHQMTNGGGFIAPLTFLTPGEHYMNMGASWYVMNTYTDGTSTVVTGIMIKTESGNSNGISGEMNPKLYFNKGLVSVGLNADTEHIVRGKDGAPLFSVVKSDSFSVHIGLPVLKWMAILLMAIGVVFYHTVVKSRKSFYFYITGLVILRGCARILSNLMDPSIPFFSPMVYAVNGMYDSFASFILSNMMIYLLLQGGYIIRATLYQRISYASKRRRMMAGGITVVVTFLLLLYIHLSLTSLVQNSNIVLELFRVTEVNWFSIISFVSFALLFVALSYCIETSSVLLFGKRKFSIMSTKRLLWFAVIASLYSVSVVSFAGSQREWENNKVLTDKLAVNRDLHLELKLRTIEAQIASDQMISTFSFFPSGGLEIIKNRIVENYLMNAVGNRYNLSVTACDAGNQLLIDRNIPPVNCYDFYQDEIIRYGVPLSPGSRFFHMDRFNGKTSYLGIFEYFNRQTYGTSRLFIEIEKKYIQDSSGEEDDDSVPRQYSYAKYVGDKIAYYSGDYDYPSEINTSSFKMGYSRHLKSGYHHFVNKSSEDEMVVVSRPGRSPFEYVVFASYLFLFYGAVLVVVTLRLRKRDFIRIPVHTFKRRITLLVTILLFLALAFVGAGSVLFTIQRSASASEDDMKTNIKVIQSRLSEYCLYIDNQGIRGATPLFEAVDRLARNMRRDINLYDTYGSLVRTTRSELFENFVLGSRMNYKAYKAIAKDNALRYIATEKIDGNKYYSIYAPLFNSEGKTVAIVNLPLIARYEQFRENSLFSIATIINLYLLLMFVSVILGVTMANSITKPITEIKSKMESLSLSTRKQHIYYKDTKDEIGLLVSAYNKMVDDLEESTRQLSEREREQAWKEMARQIAHEIKNPLTPMRLSIQHMIRLKKNNIPGWETKFDDLSHSLLEQIDILSETASEFSSFAKFYNEPAVKLNLVELIDEQMVLFNTRDDVKIEFVNFTGEAWVFVRRSQIIRAFVNLISNAIQAVEGIEGAYVRITLDSEDFIYVVAIEDNGPGVRDENLEKLFKPNFTTKSSGTGLGLAISASIMNQSGGSIYYEKSELGGAGFFMNIPKA